MESNFVEETAKTDEFYLGYEQWMPPPPKVQKPRSVFNAASLAYIGDCIYEVLFLFFSFSLFSLWGVFLVQLI